MHRLSPPNPAPIEPQVGQEGKDVVWVPTPQALVDRMLDMAKVTPNDYVMDLGSGDGRTVITAAKRGVRATGIEYNPDMVELSKRNAEKEGVDGQAEFTKADLFETDFSKATVITMFLLPDINLRLRPKILDMKPGTRVVSNTFTMGEWEADETSTVAEASGYYRTALLWIVPAKVEGTWKSRARRPGIQAGVPEDRRQREDEQRRRDAERETTRRSDQLHRRRRRIQRARQRQHHRGHGQDRRQDNGMARDARLSGPEPRIASSPALLPEREGSLIASTSHSHGIARLTPLSLRERGRG